MNGYIDTSVLAACFIQEPTSDACEKTLNSLESMVISSLVEVEFYSVIARKIRMKDITKPEAQEATDAFESLLAKDYFQIVQLDKLHQHIAKRWLSRFDIPLRTLDALHLAIAYENELTMITADQPLASCAKKLRVSHKLIK